MMKQKKDEGYLFGLKRMRKALRLSQEDLAAACGTSRESVRLWESGLSWPSAKYLPALAKALGCSIEDLYI